jgi:hypothetical protein
MNRYDRRLRIDDNDVDVSRLIAMSGSNVSSVDHHHYLGRKIEVRLGCWRHRGLEIGSDTMLGSRPPKSMASARAAPSRKQKSSRARGRAARQRAHASRLFHFRQSLSGLTGSRPLLCTAATTTACRSTLVPPQSRAGRSRGRRTIATSLHRGDQRCRQPSIGVCLTFRAQSASGEATFELVAVRGLRDRTSRA